MEILILSPGCLLRVWRVLPWQRAGRWCSRFTLCFLSCQHLSAQCPNRTLRKKVLQSPHGIPVLPSMVSMVFQCQQYLENILGNCSHLFSGDKENISEKIQVLNKVQLYSLMHTSDLMCFIVLTSWLSSLCGHPGHLAQDPLPQSGHPASWQCTEEGRKNIT